MLLIHNHHLNQKKFGLHEVYLEKVNQIYLKHDRPYLHQFQKILYF